MDGEERIVETKKPREESRLFCHLFDLPAGRRFVRKVEDARKSIEAISNSYVNGFAEDAIPCFAK